MARKLSPVGSRRPSEIAPETFTFETKLVRVGTLYGVDVPAAVSSTIGVRGYVPVTGNINGALPFSASLVPRGGGRHRILLNADLRAKARLALGRQLRMELCVDDDPPQWATPDDLADALRDEGEREKKLDRESRGGTKRR
jgi:Domain of unknown function (DUF1905)